MSDARREQNMAKTRVLSREEEIELFRRYREENDKEAFETIIVNNQGLVKSVAKDYLYSGMEFEELVSEGQIGLIAAIRKFDYKRGFKFSTYVIAWIRQSIGRFIKNNNRTIRLPVHVSEKVTKIIRFKQEFENDCGREPSNEEIAEGVGMSEADVERYLTASTPITSLQSVAGEDSELGDFIEDQNLSVEEVSELNERDRKIYAGINQLLNERERFIIIKRFGLFGSEIYTLDQVGEMLGITRERVRQIENIALKKMKLGFDRVKAA